MNTRNNTENKQELFKKTSLMRKCDFKKFDITLPHKGFPESRFNIVKTAVF